MIKISIVTVVKNGLPFLKSAIKSVRTQEGFKKNEIEHIIVCSPSNDGTEVFLKKTKSINLIFDYKSKNKFGSINLGIKKCKGNIIGLLHADDIFYSSRTLKSVMNNFDNKTDVIYGNVLFSKKNDLTVIKRKWVSSNFKRNKIFLGWMPPHTTMFIKKNILLNNLYKTEYKISGDYFFILKLLNSKNIKIKYVNQFITLMRTGGDSTRLHSFVKKFVEDFKILKKFQRFPYITVFLKIFLKIHQIQFFKYKLNSNYIKNINKII